MSATLSLNNISMTYYTKTDETKAIDNLSFDVNKGEFVAIVGPSGCGKTTILSIIAGILKPTFGEVLLNGSKVEKVNNEVGYMLQHDHLFEWRTIYKNIILGLEIQKKSSPEALAHIENLLEKYNLKDFKKYYPSQLSGGMRQRVALIRTLALDPDVLLLDEPLGALDLKMRKDMQIELMNMHRQLGITFIYVTHDQEEALTMSDTIVVMKDGVIQQIANPQKIYDEPANAFVADFIGESNILSGTFIKDCLVDVLGHQLACVDKGFKKKEPVDVIIRPEDIELLPEDDEKAYLFARVTSCVFKGDHFQTTVETDDEEKNELLIHNNFASGVNQRVGVYVKPFDLHIMHKNRIINELVTVMWDLSLIHISEPTRRS